MASYPTAPSQIPAFGITAPGSSDMLTYAPTALSKEFQAPPSVLPSYANGKNQDLFSSHHSFLGCAEFTDRSLGIKRNNASLIGPLGQKIFAAKLLDGFLQA